MTAPVPDAFSAMNHDAPVRRSSRSSSRSLTRSPSPKISFATPAHVHPVPTRPTIRQRKSKTTSVPEPTVAEVSDEADEPVSNGHVATVVEVKAEARPIDWEIPRKILHSSIGMCLHELLHRLVLMFAFKTQASSRCISMQRMDLHNTLSMPWLAPSASSSPRTSSA